MDIEPLCQEILGEPTNPPNAVLVLFEEWLPPSWFILQWTLWRSSLLSSIFLESQSIQIEFSWVLKLPGNNFNLKCLLPGPWKTNSEKWKHLKDGWWMVFEEDPGFLKSGRCFWNAHFSGVNELVRNFSATVMKSPPLVVNENKQQKTGREKFKKCWGWDSSSAPGDCSFNAWEVRWWPVMIWALGPL